MGIIAFLIFGLVVGAIARFLVPGRQSMGLLKTMALGCAGSLVGGTIAAAIAGDFSLQSAGWIGSILGAIGVLLFAMRSSRSLRA